MDFFPVFFTLKQQPCLIVGGGAEATRKARLLHSAGAVLSVVEPHAIDRELVNLIAASGGVHHSRSWQAADVDQARLVIVATDDNQLNTQISAYCQSCNIPVNVVDTPSLCSFIVPAIVDRSPIVAAISSGGESPVLARQARKKLEQTLPPTYGELGAFASRWRDSVKHSLQDTNQRRQFWESVLDGAIADLVTSGRIVEADLAISAALASAITAPLEGQVSFVVLGSTDPDLLTIKAWRHLQQAEVAFYDELMGEQLLTLVRRDAEQIMVSSAMPLPDILPNILAFTRQGRRVVRFALSNTEQVADLENLHFALVAAGVKCHWI